MALIGRNGPTDPLMKREKNCLLYPCHAVLRELNQYNDAIYASAINTSYLTFATQKAEVYCPLKTALNFSSWLAFNVV